MPHRFCAVQPLNMLTNLLTKLRLLRSTKRDLVILDNVNGVIPPRRLTLLLGPPSAGKTTLLKALAGKLRGVKVRAAFVSIEAITRTCRKLQDCACACRLRLCTANTSQCDTQTQIAHDCRYGDGASW